MERLEISSIQKTVSLFTESYSYEIEIHCTVYSFFG